MPVVYRLWAAAHGRKMCDWLREAKRVSSAAGPRRRRTHATLVGLFGLEMHPAHCVEATLVGLALDFSEGCVTASLIREVAHRAAVRTRGGAVSAR